MELPGCAKSASYLILIPKENPALDPAGLAAVRLVLDRTPAGVVVLDNVGFRR